MTAGASAMEPHSPESDAVAWMDPYCSVGCGSFFAAATLMVIAMVFSVVVGVDGGWKRNDPGRGHRPGSLVLRQVVAVVQPGPAGTFAAAHMPFWWFDPATLV